MGLASLSVVCVVLCVFVSSSASRDASQEIKPLPKVFTQRSQIRKLTKIPKHFEVKSNALATFDRYIGDIENIAKEHNYTIKYNVKVNIVHKSSKNKKKHKLMKKIKKYNVPLKKQGMGLTPFEKMMRKLAEEKNTDEKENEPYAAVTFHNRQVLVTKQPFSGKYKPLPSKLKTNFVKHVKPVRNKVITL